jgi:hypothetical protein
MVYVWIALACEAALFVGLIYWAPIIAGEE